MTMSRIPKIGYNICFMNILIFIKNKNSKNIEIQEYNDYKLLSNRNQTHKYLNVNFDLWNNTFFLYH